MSQHILIVDDDPQIRQVLRIALKQAGYAVSEAGDGAEGLTKARSGRFDLIVLDIGLPEMDGLAVCRELRRSDQTPVLFLTARDDEIDRVLGFELGGDDYVTKPFSPRELVGRIKAIHDFGGGDLLEIVDTPDRKGAWMIPFTTEQVPHVSISDRMVTIAPLEEVEGDKDRDTPSEN